MAEDWRVTLDFDDEGDGTQFAEWLAAVELASEERDRFGDRVVVGREGPRVFLYADTGARARAALETVTRRLQSEGRRAGSSLERWHPVEQAWKDASVPLPGTEAELRAEHERQQQREAAESYERGRAAWEVRIELPDHEETLRLAEQLESRGIPVVRRSTFLLVGAANEDEAHELADELSRDSPPGARIEVEPGGGLVWEVMPSNPFAVFGGLGS